MPAAREILYEEIVIQRDSPEGRGMMTLPHVYIGAILVGGGTDTMAVAGSGMLDDLLVD